MEGETLEKTERLSLTDRSFDSAMKSIVNRDFFPNLTSTQTDTSLDSYPTLNSFLATCGSTEVSQFLHSIENDRKLLLSASAVPPSAPSALFSAPTFVPPKGITFQAPHTRRIAYDQTRFEPAGRRRDLPLSRPSPMETSASETESEFEGRSHFRRQLLAGATFSQLRPERFIRKRRARGLSTQGKALLDSLEGI
jgi:hypothetical protein